VDPWRRISTRRLQRCRVFDVDEVHFEPPGGGQAQSFYCIDCPDWINVIPLTAEREVLLVRQYRFGTGEITLEIPGGMCDPGESPEETARRELHEETGFEARRWTGLGWVHPNPALQNNRCHTFLAQDLVPVPGASPDPHEEVELVRRPLSSIPDLIARREITHSLVVAAFVLLHGRP
jgi:8-oxo-dGTP pyrophosphatase MutT (NUDIX family)